MKLEEHIRKKVFEPRLNRAKVLVVHDPDRRYRDIVQEMGSDKLQVVFGDESTIEPRQKAQNLLVEIGRDKTGTKALLVYIDRKLPVNDRERQMEPFSALSVAGEAFPDGDGDSFQALCRKAKPEHAAEVDRLFAEGDPSFEHLDALDEGQSGGWPRLKVLAGGSSSEDLLFNFLIVDEEKIKKWDESDDWVREAKQFVLRVLGHKLVTEGRKWKSLAAETWRFILFSEFAFDLPGELPESLAGVPRAEEFARHFIYGLCDRLRDSKAAKEAYVDHAKEVAMGLKLDVVTGEIKDFGDRDTFAFEERAYLKHFAETALEDEIIKAQEIYEIHRHSIWVAGGGRASDWDLAGRSLELLKTIDDFKREHASFPDKLEALVDVYLKTGRVIDTLHREFHQAWEQLEDDPSEEIRKLAERVDDRYNELVSIRVFAFTTAVSKQNWPPSNLDSNRDVYAKYVEPALEGRDRVAYFLVDSIRYELALGLKNSLDDSFSCELKATAAQLPTITPVGMASLLPGAKDGFFLKNQDDNLVPTINGKEVSSPSHRLDQFREKLGDRVQMEKLDDLLEKGGRLKIEDRVNLLVIRTTEIDQAGEVSASFALREIPRALSRLKRALRILSERGFKTAVIATDHGFHLARSSHSGSKVEKPTGEWIMSKDRCLLGSGTPGPGTIALSPESVDLPTDAKTYCVPKGLGTFISGKSYFHAGLSPQECILPVLITKLSDGSDARQNSDSMSITLGYRNGRTNIVTTRRPSIMLTYIAEDMFDAPEIVNLGIQAKQKSKVVGEVALGDFVDASTLQVKIEKTKSISITLRLDDDLDGKFEVVAYDPETQLIYDTLELKTDILV
jgi:hypothetical protein